MGHVYEAAFINHVVLKGLFKCPVCLQAGNFLTPNHSIQPWCDWYCCKCYKAFEMKTTIPRCQLPRGREPEFHGGSHDDLLSNHIALSHNAAQHNNKNGFFDALKEPSTYIVFVPRSIKNEAGEQPLVFSTFDIGECTPEHDNMWKSPRRQVYQDVPLSWSKLTEGCYTLLNDVRRNFQVLFKEFYDEKGELKDTDHTIRDLFSNKNAPTIGKSTLRERYHRLLSNQNVLSSALPPPAIPIFPSVNNEPVTNVCQSHEKGKNECGSQKGRPFN